MRLGTEEVHTTRHGAALSCREPMGCPVGRIPRSTPIPHQAGVDACSNMMSTSAPVTASQTSLIGLQRAQRPASHSQQDRVALKLVSDL